MFLEIKDIRDKDLDIRIPILANMGYLMNNIKEDRFLNLLDKNIQYISSLLPMSMLIGCDNIKDIIESNITDLINIEASYFEEKYHLDELDILLELSQIITNINKFFELPKCSNSFFKKFSSLKLTPIKPTDEIYKSYVKIYKLFYCSCSFGSHSEMRNRLNDNMKIMFNLIDIEDRIIFPYLEMKAN